MKSILTLTSYYRFEKKIVDELTPHQKQFIELVADKVVNLNRFQFKYFNQRLEDSLLSNKSMSLLKVNTDWPTVADLENPTANPGFFKQQELMSQLTKFLGTHGGPNTGVGQGKATGKSDVKEAKVEDKKAKAVSFII